MTEADIKKLWRELEDAAEAMGVAASAAKQVHGADEAVSEEVQVAFLAVDVAARGMRALRLCGSALPLEAHAVVLQNNIDAVKRLTDLVNRDVAAVAVH